MGIMYDELEGMGQSIVTELTDRAERAGVTDAVGSVLEGTPHQAILEYADEHHIDLIVMGTHGRDSTGISWEVLLRRLYDSLRCQC